MKFSIKSLSIFALLVASLFLLADKSRAVETRHALSDVNRDGVISLLDQKLINDNFGLINPEGVYALADVNQDGIIDSNDLKLVTTKKGEFVSSCEMADLNSDGQVNLPDFDIATLYYRQKATFMSMMVDVTGDGYIDILDLARMGGLFGCTW